MKISVIVTTHNTKDYLLKCIDSLVNQTISEIEIIIVDDASTDTTADVARQISQTYKNVSLLLLDTSLGPGGARNKGLEVAKGKYVAFIDSDDWVDLNYFQTLYEHIEKAGANIATCGLIREYDYEVSTPIYKCKYEQQYSFSGEIAFRIMTNEYNYGIKYLPSALNKIYNKNFLDKNFLRFPENIFFEDQPFSYTCTLAAQKVICVPGTLYHHCKRSGSIVQSFKKKNIDDLMKAYNMIRDYLQTNNIYEKYRFNYYSSLQHFYNLIIRQIFEFVADENHKKELIKYSFLKLKDIINIDEYIDFLSAEELRRHIQPNITDTIIN